MVRFAVVGIAATGLHYAIYRLTMRVMPVNMAYSLGYAVSFIGNFMLTCRFTFRTRPTRKRLIRFAASHLANYALQVAVLNIALVAGCEKGWALVPVWAISVPVSFVMTRIAIKERRKT